MPSKQELIKKDKVERTDRQNRQATQERQERQEGQERQERHERQERQQRQRKSIKTRPDENTNPPVKNTSNLEKTSIQTVEDTYLLGKEF